MEYILLVAIAVNLAATAYVGTLLRRREEYRVEFVSLPPEYLGLDLVDEPVAKPQPEQQKEILQAEVPQAPRVNKSYSPWENRTNIPWVESTRPADAPVSLKKDPLARPDGFI